MSPATRRMPSRGRRPSSDCDCRSETAPFMCVPATVIGSPPRLTLTTRAMRRSHQGLRGRRTSRRARVMGYRLRIADPSSKPSKRRDPLARAYT
jgi:hypothetical protein